MVNLPAGQIHIPKRMYVAVQSAGQDKHMYFHRPTQLINSKLGVQGSNENEIINYFDLVEDLYHKCNLQAGNLLNVEYAATQEFRKHIFRAILFRQITRSVVQWPQDDHGDQLFDMLSELDNMVNGLPGRRDAFKHSIELKSTDFDRESQHPTYPNQHPLNLSEKNWQKVRNKCNQKCPNGRCSADYLNPQKMQRLSISNWKLNGISSAIHIHCYACTCVLTNLLKDMYSRR